MKEKYFCLREKLKLLMKLSCYLLFMGLLGFPVEGYGQEKRFTFKYKQVPLSSVCLYIEKNSDYSFIYNVEEVQKVGLKDYKFNHVVEIEKGVMETECKKILQQFFKELREKKKK